MIERSPTPALLAHIHRRSRFELSPAMPHLCEVLQARFGDATAAMVFYGSCLRDGAGFDGLLDLYVLVDGYRAAHGPGLSALANRLLPPNVYYLEEPFEGAVVRAKVAVVSLEDFRRGCGRWFHPYLWGRFAQPAALVYCRDEASREQVLEALALAVMRLLGETLGCLPHEISVLEAWQRGLTLSYGCELRAERPTRVQGLVAAYAEEYRQVTPLALAGHPAATVRGATLRAMSTPWQRRWSRLRWGLRRVQGLGLSLARLAKASFTFWGGVDYLAWKLERHTGEKILVSQRLRRWPLVFVWGQLWRLYRRRVVR